MGNKISVAFFHPYCNAGGGGERVLWCCVDVLRRLRPDLHLYIYTGDPESGEEIIQKAKERFNIQPPDNVHFVKLKKRHWIEAERYPYFTMLGQSLGSVVLGVEALFRLNPDIFIDTMGYAFTYPLFSLFGGSTVVCYTHYPTISGDMLQVIRGGEVTFNNRSRNRLFTAGKLIYYNLFAKCYGFVGRFSELVMVNSTWTKNHINDIWQIPNKTHILYPPCDTSSFEQLPLDISKRKLKIISIAQFRPEKNHRLQLESFAEFLKKTANQTQKNQIKLVLIGSTRGAEDERRLEELKVLAKEFGIESQVKFKKNVSFQRLIKNYSNSLVGLHTMKNEHFGIGVVELMAAGLITIAHNSAGPAFDIISHNKTGFLASTVQEYAEHFELIFSDPKSSRLHQIQLNARDHVNKFSQESFLLLLKSSSFL